MQGDLHTVFADATQIPAGDGVHGFARVKPVAVSHVAGPIALRQQRFHHAPREFIPAIAEQFLHCPVHRPDPPVRVQHQHAVGRGLHRQQQRLLLPFVAGDVVPQAMVSGKCAARAAQPGHRQRLMDDGAVVAHGPDFNVSVAAGARQPGGPPARGRDRPDAPSHASAGPAVRWRWCPAWPERPDSHPRSGHRHPAPPIRGAPVRWRSGGSGWFRAHLTISADAGRFPIE